jgi:hypothetical protein
MRALPFLGAATAALLLGGCETAFVGRAPGGRYALAEVNGRALPYVDSTIGACPVTVQGGGFDLDPVARRFEMTLDRTGPCAAAAVDAREAGSYIRRHGRLELEAAQPGGGSRALIATEAGGVVSLTYGGLRLRFRQVAPAPR